METILKNDLNVFRKINIDKILSDAEKEIENPNTELLTHEEVFEKAKEVIIGK